ncbi:MAG: hypothetical protein M5U29_01120 [Anaerolineae bacterium]|nr:hypothetical protein [Anaerolineae bacterium]
MPTQHNLRDLRERGFQRLRLWQRGADTACFSPAHRSAEMRRRLLGGRPMTACWCSTWDGWPARSALISCARWPIWTAWPWPSSATARCVASWSGCSPGAPPFSGYLTGANLSTAYASADVFGFTGTNGVAGQVVIEAMASALPVLVPHAAASWTT